MDTKEDEMLRELIEDVSRDIDGATGRHFYVQVAVHRYTAKHADHLLLPDDLLAVTELATDSAADLSYATVWATTDYRLGPADAPTYSTPRPYYKIHTAPSGTQSFGTTLEGVRVTGRWGYYQVLRRNPSLMAEALDTTETELDVDSGGDFEVGLTILIGSEQMFVTAIHDNKLTVERAVNGTTAATHADNDPIDVYTYPVVTGIALMQCAQQYMSQKAPGGVIGGSEFGPIRLAAMHPLVAKRLQRFRHQEMS